MAASFTAETLHTGKSIIDGTTALVENGTIQHSSGLLLVDMLNLDNRASNSGDRLGDSMPVEFWGGRLRLICNTSAPTSERIGAMLFSGGGSIEFLQASNPALPITLIAASLDRSFGSFGYVDVDPANGKRILLDNPPPVPGIASVGGPTARPVVPYLRAGYALDSLVTYDTGANPLDPSDDVGLRRLDPATEFASAIGSGGVPENVWIKSNQTVSSASTVNALIVESDLTINDTLSIASGSITLRQRGPDVPQIVGTGRLRVAGEAIISAAGPGVIGVPLEAQKMTVTGEVTLAKANDVAGGTWLIGDIASRAQAGLCQSPGDFGSSDSTPASRSAPSRHTNRSDSGTR